VHWIKEALHRLALERLFMRDSRHLSLVDCTSFLLMEAEGIHEVFALDRDFEDEGFRVLPSN
jgi:predicted nucleic acid-binding protein